MQRIRNAGSSVAAISGNHNGADRVSPYDDLLDHSGIYIRGGYQGVGRVVSVDFPDQPLDPEVLDADTGRPRSPRPLSGGKQFQASLALALGLADIVSHSGTASGRKVEAPFIDEGLGSLDPQTLDDAIKTLHQLRATGPMVGAITHVEAMKERLHAGIVVSHLPDGKCSTLAMHGVGHGTMLSDRSGRSVSEACR